MAALMKRLVAKTTAPFSRPRPQELDGDEALHVLEQFLSAYWPEARAERMTDAEGEPALKIMAVGRPTWILTPAPELLAFARRQADHESLATEGRGCWGENHGEPNDAAIGSVSSERAGWWRGARPNTAAIG